MPNMARTMLMRMTPRLVVLIAVGCSSADERLVDLSRQSVDRQAEQNRLVETNNRQVLESTNKLLEADAHSRTQALEMQRQIAAERSGINQQRDALEQERRQIAHERNRDPIVAESIQAAAGLMAAVLPLLVCLALLRGWFHKTEQEVLADVLIQELVSQTSLIRAANALSLSSDVRCPRSPSTDRETPKKVPIQARLPPTGGQPAACLVVLEGANDVEFLRRISRSLHADNGRLPDLNRLEATGRLAFLTSDARTLASIQVGRSAKCCQFHLLDREMPPIDGQRRCLVDSLNQNPNCRAFLTTKRSIENYLHPVAVRQASGIEVEFGDFDGCSGDRSRCRGCPASWTRGARTLCQRSEAAATKGQKVAQSSGGRPHDAAPAEGARSTGRGHRLADHHR